MNEEPEVSTSGKKRKGVKHPETYKRNIIKKSRTSGVEYTNYKGHTVEAKALGAPCRCPLKCFENVDADQRQKVFSKFYNMETKNEQDVYLQAHIEVKEVARRRKQRSTVGSRRSRSFNHFIDVDISRKKVCQGAFLSMHAIGRERMKRLQRLLITGESPRDRRGKNIKGNAIDAGIRDLISNHISSFPVKTSHYSNKEYKYLDARLNVKIMYDLFKVKYLDSTVKYSYYLKYFHENFDLHFGRPQVDTCNVCEELNVKIKSPRLAENIKRCAVAEKIIHCRRSKKFYRALQASLDECEQRNDIEALAFDYMQNLQLPQIPVQDLFYLTQLTVSVFCIHNLKTRRSIFYVYHEGVAGKSPNEVCSFLLDYVDNYIAAETKELHLFSDNCPGQNKNQCLIRMCLALTDTKRFNKIQHFFPIRGHSFLPCDRVFGLVKRNLRHFDRVYDVHKYTEIIITASGQKQFTVKEIQTEDILNFKNWWQKFYKANAISQETASLPRSDRQKFAVSKYHHFKYSANAPGCVMVAEFIDGFVWSNFQLAFPKRKQNSVHMPTEAAYLERLPILETKLEHLKTLLQWVEDTYKPFYEDIIENSVKKQRKAK